jgi:hypothetical protein
LIIIIIVFSEKGLRFFEAFSRELYGFRPDINADISPAGEFGGYAGRT